MTVSTQTITVTANATALGETRSSSKRDASSLGADALPDVGASLFDVVLRESTSISAGGVAVADPRLTPSLMFEPAELDRRAASRTGGEDEARREVNRYDRTSVDSRRSHVDSRAGETRTDDAGRGSHQTARSAIPHDASTAQRMSFDRENSPISGHMTAHHQQATRAEVSEGGTHSRTTGAMPASVAAPRSGVTSTAAPGVGRVSGSAETSRTPAMLVGRLLASGQGADSEGLRGGAHSGAAGSSARATEPGDTPATRSPTGRSSAGRGAESSGSSDRVKSSMFDQLVRSIRLNANVRHAGSAGRHSSARLQLNPPELGRMHVEVSVSDERARILIKTQTDAARWLVQQRASELVASLARHGISVERMEVGAEVLTDQQARLDGRLGETGDLNGTHDAVAHGANQQAEFTGRYSEGFDADQNASEDATIRLVEPGTEPVEPADRSELAVVTESRLDIRV